MLSNKADAFRCPSQMLRDAILDLADLQVPGFVCLQAMLASTVHFYIHV